MATLDVYGNKRLTVLSLSLLLITGALWEMSYVCVHYTGKRFATSLESGCIAVGYRVTDAHGWPEDVPWRGVDGFEVQGFYGWTTDVLPRVAMSGGLSFILLPLWIAFALFSLLPARSIFLERRLKTRLLNGLCGECGYDLRASSRRCPECGCATESLGKEDCDMGP